MVDSIQDQPSLPTECMSIAEALQLLAKGRDPAAWEALLTQTGTDIFRISRRITGDRILAEDACQETLLQIRDHAKNFKAPGAPERVQAAAKTWIIRIATFTAMDLQRSRVRAQRREQNAAPLDTSAAMSPEISALKAEQFALLRREIAALPETLREPILLHYFGELDYETLSDQLSCSTMAVKKRIQRGLQQLRTRLAVLGLVLSLADLSGELSGGAAHAAESAATAVAGKSVVTGTQKAAWSGVLKSASAPALSGIVPMGGLSNMAKISMMAASIVLASAGSIAILNTHAQETAPAPVPKVAPVVPPPIAKPAEDITNAVVRQAPATPHTEEPWKQDLNKKLSMKVSFEFADTPLEEAIASLIALVPVNIIIDPKVVEKNGNKTPITLRVQDMEANLALKWVLTLANLDYDVRNHAVFISYPEKLAQAAPPAEPVPLPAEAWKKAIQNKLTRKITFHFDDIDLVDAISFLRQASGITMIIDPKVIADNPPPINLRVTDMRIDQALAWTLRLEDLTYTLRDNAIFITKEAENDADAGVKKKKTQPEEF